MARFSLNEYGLTLEGVVRNPSPAVLYELALRHEKVTRAVYSLTV